MTSKKWTVKTLIASALLGVTLFVSSSAHAACTNNYLAQAYVSCGPVGGGAVRCQVDPWDIDNMTSSDGLRVWNNGRVWEYYDNVPQSWYYDKILSKGSGRRDFYAKEKSSCGATGAWVKVYTIVVP